MSQSLVTARMDNHVTFLVELKEELRHQKEYLEETVQKRTIELQQALEAKSRFLSTISHGICSLYIYSISEIRTPMNGLFGMIDLLSYTEMTSDQKAFKSQL